MTKEAYYKIGILIMALCAITWMFMSNSWGAESIQNLTLQYI